MTDKIASCKARKLMLINAPAGFGKTLLVCQWIQQAAPQVAWIEIDEDDSKPETFSLYLLAALQTFDKELRTALIPFIHSQIMPPPERSLPSLC